MANEPRLPNDKKKTSGLTIGGVGRDIRDSVIVGHDLIIQIVQQTGLQMPQSRNLTSQLAWLQQSIPRLDALNQVTAQAAIEKIDQAIADLPAHEQRYRQRIKKSYAEEAGYYVPLVGETRETTPLQTERQPRSSRRIRSRADAEYCEWITSGREIKREKLKTLREGVDKYARVILLGDPGSGKTTALENLAYQFAGEPEILPLPLRLSEFQPRMSLDEFIIQGWGGTLEDNHWGVPELVSNLDGYLEEGRLFFLFDALNEMPARKKYDKRSGALRRFIDRWTSKGNRFMVTCRELDYGEELSGLQRIEVQPLNDDQIQEFLVNELPGDWRSLWQVLTKGDEGEHRLLEMARNPYLLTMMIDVYVEDGQLDQNRADLMTRFTQTLMRWAKEKTPVDQRLDADVQVESLSVLAYEMQSRAGSGSVVKTSLAKNSMPKRVQIDPKWDPVPSPPDQVLTLAASAKIIEMPVDRSSVRFYHQLLQEYFAAHQMLKRDPSSLTDLWRWPWLEKDMPLWVRPEDNYDPLPPPPPKGWEETTILASGLATENDDQLVRALIQVNPVLAGRCLYEGQAKVDDPVRQSVIDHLLGTISRPEVALRVRIAAGEVLGYLGDQRLGNMVAVDAGEFLMGSDPERDSESRDSEQPQHLVYVSEFHIGKYPVANTEYRQFVEDGGYKNKRWWTEAGWDWKKKREQPDYWDDSRYNKPNQPVVGVSWFECVAYCRWLSAERDTQYRLPTESEWEKAARGEDGRKYPWGDVFEPDRLNSFEGEQQVLTATPVGIYPAGASPWGLYDCAGNVWEWCATRWQKVYPYDVQEDEWQIDYIEGQDGRLVRGGAFSGFHEFARCAFRSWDFPNLRGGRYGFRVVVCAPL